MTNALLEAADGKRRLFIATDRQRRARCPMLVRSLRNYRHERDLEGGDGRHNHELSHWSDAMGYGLYPFEKIRGEGVIGPVPRARTQKK